MRRDVVAFIDEATVVMMPVFFGRRRNVERAMKALQFFPPMARRMKTAMVPARARRRSQRRGRLGMKRR